MTDYQHIVHPFAPVFDERSEILILGTLPSVKSRENSFYYGHPRNRFWPLIARLTGEAVPASIPEKRALLLRNRIALWDVIHSCDIRGSDDSSIRNAVPTDLRQILQEAQISAVFANGSTAARLYRKYQEPIFGIPIEVLPSTSPANAARTLDMLTEFWQTAIFKNS